MPTPRQETLITKHTLIAYRVQQDTSGMHSGEFPIVHDMPEDSFDPDQLVTHPLPTGHMNKVMTHLMNAVVPEQSSDPNPELIAQIFAYELIQNLTE